MTQRGLDTPAPSLQQPQKPRDDLLNNLLPQHTQLPILPTRQLGILQRHTKISREPLLPQVRPGIEHRRRAPERRDLKPELSLRR